MLDIILRYNYNYDSLNGTAFGTFERAVSEIEEETIMKKAIGLSLAAMMVAAGYGENVIAMASSHFGSAERQFRFPLEYGNQRPFSATWTVTGCGAAIVTKRKGFARITGVTTGKIIDYGVKDAQNMGACMAPAAADVIYNHLNDFGTAPDD